MHPHGRPLLHRYITEFSPLSENSRSTPVHMSVIFHNLNWPSLQQWCRINRSQTFYKTKFSLSVLPIPSYFFLTLQFTRSYHPHHYFIPSTWNSSYKHSFDPTTIREWNITSQIMWLKLLNNLHTLGLWAYCLPTI